MKQQILNPIKELLKDRYVTTLLLVFIGLCIAVFIYLAVAVRPSELQLVIHYTSFGETNFYRDKWFYLISFVVFLVVMAVSHAVLTYKLLQTKGRDLTVAFLYLSILMVVIAAASFYQVLKVASLS